MRRAHVLQARQDALLFDIPPILLLLPLDFLRLAAALWRHGPGFSASVGANAEEYFTGPEKGNHKRVSNHDITYKSPLGHF